MSVITEEHYGQELLRMMQVLHLCPACSIEIIKTQSKMIFIYYVVNIKHLIILYMQVY